MCDADYHRHDRSLVSLWFLVKVWMRANVLTSFSPSLSRLWTEAGFVLKLVIIAPDEVGSQWLIMPGAFPLHESVSDGTSISGVRVDTGGHSKCHFLGSSC